MYETKKDLKENDLQSTIVGHVGDGVLASFAKTLTDRSAGNFHALIMFNEEEMPRVTEVVHRMVSSQQST